MDSFHFAPLIFNGRNLSMAHSNWLYQTRDIMFQIKEWLGVEKLLALDAYKDYYGMDDIDS
ncbi:MAG: acyl-CoA dehydrogenase N-terminal domain-containing protein, partial [Syntrophaceae bacterium]|nr:acyl-CoA dehydrogenase N-terminal domain-containing protein [Syntrophaceae bacterium]